MFSVIVTDYDKSIPRDLVRRKMRCLAAQTCDDFEVIVYHDGPKAVPYATELADVALHPRTRFVVTETRANDWGHSNRDRGIREAEGAWIIHSNADNVFYPTLIERLKAAATDAETSYVFTQRRFPVLVKSVAKRIDKWFGADLRQMKLTETAAKQILIYAIQMRGMFPVGHGAVRFRDRAADSWVIFGGIPVVHGMIDAMQLVMRRDLWLAEGGWYDRTEEGDGHMYESFAKKYAVRAVPEVLGEHW